MVGGRVILLPPTSSPAEWRMVGGRVILLPPTSSPEKFPLEVLF